MTWLDVRPEAIPAELRTLPWVLWRAEPRGGDKPAKVPYRVHEPTIRASSTDATTWSTFTDAIDAYSVLTVLPADPRRGPVAGVGVVLTQSAHVVCVDLDRVIEDGRLDPRAAKIVERCASWTETSPSAGGLHIFVRGSIPSAIKGDQIEVYSTDRYIAITGHRWPGTPEGLRAAHGYLTGLHRKAHESDRSPSVYTGPRTPAPDDLAGALLAKLQVWGVPVARLKRWQDGFLVELIACPWGEEHTSDPGGAVVMIRASGAFDFMCQHAHCASRRWREFRAAMEPAR